MDAYSKYFGRECSHEPILRSVETLVNERSRLSTRIAELQVFFFSSSFFFLFFFLFDPFFFFFLFDPFLFFFFFFFFFFFPFNPFLLSIFFSFSIFLFLFPLHHLSFCTFSFLFPSHSLTLPERNLRNRETKRCFESQNRCWNRFSWNCYC